MQGQEQRKVPVTIRALIQRINRKLSQQPNPQRLMAARGRAQDTLGHYYTVGAAGVVNVNVDLEQFGRELGVLEQWEELV